eukprot:scaffold15758_cov63-Phaeocystis_antarctica.AAC.5
MACAWHVRGMWVSACACVHVVSQCGAPRRRTGRARLRWSRRGRWRAGEPRQAQCSRGYSAAPGMCKEAGMARLHGSVHGMHLACAWHAVWTQRSMACACVRYLPDAKDALEDVDQAPDCEGVPSRQPVHRVREGDLCVGELNEAAGRHEHVGDDHEDEDDDDRDRLDCRSARRERRSESRRHGGAWCWA